MTIIRHSDSHLDHSLTEAQIAWVLAQSAPAGEVCVQTLELPEELGTVPCALYGPVMGDEPVEEAQVSYAVRGERKGASRLLAAPARPSRLITLVTGPHDGQGCVLYTAFGGPQAPREPFEFEPREDFTSFDEIQSREFWKQHALASEDGNDHR